MKKYTALTIGPIYTTLKSAKSTKAIWGASYLFSYLMKNVIKKVRDTNENAKLIVPYSDELKVRDEKYKPLENLKNQTGIFPDRLILEGEYDLDTIADKVLDEFSDKFEKELKSKTNAKEYLKSYFSFHTLNVELDNNELAKEGSNVIYRVNELLDTLELKQKINPYTDKDYLKKFLENYQPYNFLVKYEFGQKPFPSTAEIATAEYRDEPKNYEPLAKLIRRDKENDQEQFFLRVREIFKERFRNYQKYLAVVQADGDNIGAFIKELYNQTDKENLLERFSKNLLAFAIEAVELIKEYKGTPIYAGGDDLLYFMPVAQTAVDNRVIIQSTFLTLIDEIDKCFASYFTEDEEFKAIIEAGIQRKENPIRPPSMSYGVSISYYKFPLNEALENGADLLFYTAKKTKEKNAVSFSILKHSGQHFGTTYHKGKGSSYDTFNSLIGQTIMNDNYIHSIVYKIEPQDKVLFEIGKIQNDTERNAKFYNFFWNNFDEGVHRKNKTELNDFLKETLELFKEIYTENKIDASNDVNAQKAQHDSNLKKIYASLRFIGFIINKEERND